MLRIDDESQTPKLVAPHAGSLVSEGILERTDLQAMIANSWETFVGEIGFPSLTLIGQEIQPHLDVSDRIDLLAFDDENGRAVVIELKRDSHKLQLLQALSYAAMVAGWEPSRFLEELGEGADADLRNSIENLDAAESPAIMLIAEHFEPEVILTADWLSSSHDVDIACFAITVHRFGGERLLNITQEYPLRALEDLYTARRRRTSRAGSGLKDQTWEDVKAWINYEWGRALIDQALAHKPGDPSRRRFTAPFPTQHGFFLITFQKDAVRVVIYRRRPRDKEFWSAAVPGVTVGEWGSENTRTEGLAFRLTSQAQADAFLAALQRPFPGQDGKTNASDAIGQQDVPARV